MAVVAEYGISFEEMTELGKHMMMAGLSQWSQYDDYNTFIVEHTADGVTLSDPDYDEDTKCSLTYPEFFIAHYNGVFKRGYAQVVAGQYINWCNTYDDYDDYTCDFVIQMSLYGEIVYS